MVGGNVVVLLAVESVPGVKSRATVDEDDHGVRTGEIEVVLNGLKVAGVVFGRPNWFR